MFMALLRLRITSLKSIDSENAAVEVSLTKTSPLYADVGFMFNLKENDVPALDDVVLVLLRVGNSYTPDVVVVVELSKIYKPNAFVDRIFFPCESYIE